jgi:alpha-glucosidase
MQQLKKTKQLLFFSFLLNVLFTAVLALAFIFYRKAILNKIFPDRSVKRDIVLFGDSITGEGNWNKLLKGKSVANEGLNHGGLTTSHFVNMIRTSVLDRQPRICFIEGGINDLYVGVPVPRIKANLVSLIDTLRFYKIIPVITLITYTSNDPATNNLIDSVNSLFSEIIRKCNAESINLNPKLSENRLLKKIYSRDGVHFTKEAYPVWAEEVKRILKRYNL